MSPARKKTFRFLSAAMVVLVVGLVMVGCSPAARHEVLTFFFTGVPPLEGETGTESKTEEARKPVLTAAEKARQRAAKINEVKIRRLLRAVQWAHGPFAAGECERCHALSTSYAFGSAGAASIQGGAVTQSVGTRLLAPREELCLGCHETKTPEAAEEQGLRLHGPVASGLCVGCHNPHQSPRRFMLLKKDTVELCTQCHDQEDLLARTGAHRLSPEADCLSCHNPHMGRSQMILRADYDEGGGS